MKIDYFLFFTLFSVLILACNDVEEPSKAEEGTELETYLNIKTGAYRVFELYEVNIRGGLEYVRKDSVVIGSKVQLNSTSTSGYWERITYSDDQVLVNYVKDSVGYLVNEQGVIYFALHRFDQVVEIGFIADLLIDYTFTIPSGTKQINTPAGTFRCINWMGVFVDRTNGATYRSFNYFSEGIGLIKSIFPDLRNGKTYEYIMVRKGG